MSFFSHKKAQKVQRKPKSVFWNYCQDTGLFGEANRNFTEPAPKRRFPYFGFVPFVLLCGDSTQSSSAVGFCVIGFTVVGSAFF